MVPDRVEHVFDSIDAGEWAAILLDDGPAMDLADCPDLLGPDGQPAPHDAASDAADALAAREMGSHDTAVLEALLAQPPGPAMVEALAAVDVSRLSSEAAVTWLQVSQRCQSWLAALDALGLVAAAGRIRVVEEYAVHGRDETRAGRLVRVDDAISEEVAAALRLAPRTARLRIASARKLTGPLSPMHELLAEGLLTPAHVFTVSKELARLPQALAGTSADPDGNHDPAYAEQYQRILAVALPYAVTHTPAESGRRARGLVEAAAPAEAERRREQAILRCDVDVMDDIDGQSVLSARMATPDAHVVLDAIRTLARDPRYEPGLCLSAGQRRAEALKTLVLGVPRSTGPGLAGLDASASAASIRVEPGASCPADAIATARVTAHVDVVVSLETMLGLSDRPGLLNGSGPTSAGAIRELLAACGEGSTMRRLVVDPDRSLLDAGRQRYAISDAQRAFVAARDGTCRFPGCGSRADRCQVDHAVSWDDGGPTDVANLGALCTRHHNLKTHAGWDITDAEADGSCTWRSPQLRRYERKRPDLLPVELPARRPPSPPPDPGDDPPPY